VIVVWGRDSSRFFRFFWTKKSPACAGLGVLRTGLFCDYLPAFRGLVEHVTGFDQVRDNPLVKD